MRSSLLMFCKYILTSVFIGTKIGSRCFIFNSSPAEFLGNCILHVAPEVVAKITLRDN